MDYLSAVILGIVEGATEFIPVSSTGHLILAGHLLGVTGEWADSFEIFIQLGAILAVVLLYWRRFTGLLDFHQPPGAFAGWRGIGLLALTSLPACIMGFLLHKAIKTHLFNPLTVLLALAVGGVVLLIFGGNKKDSETSPETTPQTLDDIRPKDALMVGVFQCFALWPGMSRSASTIIGGVFSGLDRKVAAEYSFLAAVPIMFLATGYDLYKTLHSQSTEAFLQHLPVFAVGFLVAFGTAVLAIRFFIALLGQWTLRPFGWYRVAIAIAALYLWALPFLSH